MSNYIEYKNEVAFHPGYYIKEIVEDSGLTQEDFAKRLGTTPKNLSVLIKGEQSLSIDIANKLSRMLGTTVDYWLNIQMAYDEKIVKFMNDEELVKEREIFKMISYQYFRDNFNFPDLPRNVDEQIRRVREFLMISSLTNLKEQSLGVNFRSFTNEMSVSNIVNANVMVQIAINKALKSDTPQYNKGRFKKAIDYALTQTSNHDGFLVEIHKHFHDAGVELVVLPNLKNSGINGATKRVDGKIMLMVNDRRHYADTFWFSLFHEIGHIVNGDYGLSVDNGAEDEADIYAQRMLIPQDDYQVFIERYNSFDENNIRRFADSINRDPGIVLGRLMKDGKVSHSNTRLSKVLRHSYIVSINCN